MNEFIIDFYKGWENADGKTDFQRITVLKNVKHMFTGVVHHKILVEDQSGCIDERWVTEEELDGLKKLATYDMRSDRLY